MHMCDMNSGYIYCDSFTRAIGIFCHTRHDSFICVTWLIHMCDMTPRYVCRDSLSICVPWLIHMCAMTHSYMRHDSFICVTWPWGMCAMTHSSKTCINYFWLDLSKRAWREARARKYICIFSLKYIYICLKNRKHNHVFLRDLKKFKLDFTCWDEDDAGLERQYT